MGYIQELRALVGHRPLILVGALVMIFDDRQRILLQHRCDSAEENPWDFPGGYMEPGESLEETARREVREETGLEVGAMRLYCVLSGKDFFFLCPNGDAVYAVTAVFITQDARGEVRPDGIEGSEYGYFALDALPDGLIRNIRILLERFAEAEGVETYGRPRSQCTYCH